MNRIALALSSCVIALALLAARAPGAEPTPAPASQPAAPEIVQQTLGDDDITVVKFSNGLTLIVKPHRAAAVVAVRCYVHTGSMYEKEWLGCGLSHLCEHLVANGEADEKTGTSAKKGLAQRVARIGGHRNASTSIDWTNYYISAAAGKANDCIDVVCDWMAHPEITREDFDREHGVVQRELEMGKDSPARQLYYTHAANLYGQHPAGVPTIGYPAPLRDVTYEAFIAYHKRMYVPGNMVFCVVGDVDVPAVIERVRKGFAGMEQGRVPDHSLPELPPVLQTRRVVAPMKEVKEAMELVSFQTVSMLDSDLYALDLLSTVAGEGPSSRLVLGVLRDKKLVTSVSTGSSTPPWGKGTFDISFRCKPESADQAEAAILAELKRLADEGVTDEELARAKRQKLSEHVRSNQNVDSIAGTLAYDYMMAADANFSAHYLKKVQAVTAQQVQQAAKKYLTFDRMVVTRLVPAEKFALAAAATQASQTSKATTFTMPSGLRVVLHPVKGAGLVSMALMTKGGLMLETPANNGMGSLMMNLTTKGAGDLSAEQIAAFFSQAGGSISAGCGNDVISWQASVLDDSFDKALAIFADCVLKPKFEAKELEIARPVALSNIDKIEENWQSQMTRFFRGEFFKGCGPYAMMPNGTKDVLQAATPEALKAYHAKCLKGGDSVLAIFGDVDATAAKAQVEKLFAAMPEGKAELPKTQVRKVDAAGELHVLKTKNQQSAVMVGLPGMTLDNMQDKFPIDVLDTIISGWSTPAGWLHEELRGKQLVYVVHAYNWAGFEPGAFVTYAAGQPEKAPEVVAIIKKNLAKAADYKPTEDEIAVAINAILTSELLGNQSMSSLASDAAYNELIGFGYDWSSKMEQNYRKVTPEDVLRIGQKYFKQGLVVTVTTPKPELLEAASQPAK